MDAPAESAVPKQLTPYAFKPGQSGNPKGRQKGSRNRLAEEFLADLLESWQTQGKAAIDRVIEKRPHEYLRVVASILPRQIELNDNLRDIADDELAALLALARAMVDTQGPAGERNPITSGPEQAQILPPVQ